MTAIRDSLPLVLLSSVVFLELISARNVTFRNVTVSIMITTVHGRYHSDRFRLAKRLDDSNRLMDVLKDRDPRRYNSLKLQGQVVPVVYEGAFSGLNVVKLSIENCGLEVIESGVFGNVTNLKHLAINGNNLGKIGNRTFEGLKAESLNLARNNIEEIENGALVNMTALQDIYLQHNSLRKISTGTFRNLSKLEFVDLRDCGVEVLEGAAFENLTALRSLFLNRNKVKVLTNHVLVNLPSLDLLDFDDNEIEIVSHFAKNVSMRTLRLANNKILEINNSFFEDVKRIHELRLSHNEISKIGTDVFKNLTGLKVLDLRDNKLEKVEKGWFDDTSIEELLLGNNSIAAIEPGAFLHADMKLLDVCHNKLKEIPRKVFDNVSIDALRLSSNSIGHIEPGAFDKSHFRNVLDLAGNELRSINASVFNNVKVGFLNFSSNWIAGAEVGALRDVLYLYEVDLGYNRIKKLEAGWFGDDRSLRRIDLGGNPVEEVPRIEDFLEGVPLLSVITMGPELITRKGPGVAKNKGVPLSTGCSNITLNGVYSVQVPRGGDSSVRTLYLYL